MTTMTDPTELRLDIGDDVAALALMIDGELRRGPLVRSETVYRRLNNAGVRPGRALTAKQMHDLLALIGVRYMQAVVEARDNHLRKDSHVGADSEAR